VPFLNLVHLRELRCVLCNEQIATAGARSFIVSADAVPVNFALDDPPAEMVVEIRCSNGHVNALTVPNEIGAEEAMMTPDSAPIAADASIVSGTTESGNALT
jgi:hypothetical protein